MNHIVALSGGKDSTAMALRLAEVGREHTSRNASRDTWPARLAELRNEFERGRIPPNTVHTDDLFQGGRRKTMCRVCSL